MSIELIDILSIVIKSMKIENTTREQNEEISFLFRYSTAIFFLIKFFYQFALDMPRYHWNQISQSCLGITEIKFIFNIRLGLKIKFQNKI